VYGGLKCTLYGGRTPCPYELVSIGVIKPPVDLEYPAPFSYTIQLLTAIAWSHTTPLSYGVDTRER